MIEMNELWEQVWGELRRELNRQPRCSVHPDLPHIRTLGQGAANDILQVNEDGILVRSHRTNNQDMIPASSFHAWWTHLQQHGTAALDPNHPNCPRSDRAVLVGAILARCLPNLIEWDNGEISLLTSRVARERPLSAKVSVEATTRDANLSEDLATILSANTADTTTALRLIEARVGQGEFRTSVLSRWDNCCAVTSSRTSEALRASHIKPWRDSTPVERLDPANGLPLVASLDALFDAGLISFADTGLMIVSRHLPIPEQAIYDVAQKRLTKPPSSDTAIYLHYHRIHCFRS